MVTERRAFSNYPELLRTRQNNRETFIADDPSFEPEQANFLNGFIGDLSVLTAEDLERTPEIMEATPERQKYQLSVGATYINPASQARESISSYTDLVNQIEANGAEITDPNRVFATQFYAWTPPIDYDKHINFGRYFWVGDGTGDVQGEYVTKEPETSKIVVHVWDGVTLTPTVVVVSTGADPNGVPIQPEGFLLEVAVPERLVYRSDGVAWQLINLEIVDDVPTSFPDPGDQPPPIYYYVARTGPDFNRPLVWRYSDKAGRWIPTPVVVSLTVPDIPREGMVWEDGRLGGERRLKVFSNGTFQDLTYTTANGLPGAPGTDGEYIYDAREYTSIDGADPWSSQNWWRHYEDLSPTDRGVLTNQDQAVRPIVEFWSGIESVAGDAKEMRNDSPVYKKYAISPTTLEGFDTGEGTTIFQYNRGPGRDDSVLGFPPEFNETGEFLFELTLEKDASSAIGYHYFLDTHTGVLHGIWHRADQLTNQAVDSDGLYEIPVGISSNADHEVLVDASRSRMVGHMTSVMGAQDTFSGSLTGQNSFRWTERDPTVGATLIDAEETHLRTMATLQSTKLDFPNAIRRMAKDYNKVLFRFTNCMNQLWDNLSLTNGNGSLYPSVTASEACDAILSKMFMGRNEDFPYFYSDMGTFLQTIITTGTVTVLDPNTQPIYVPPSPPRVGASPTYEPRSYVQRDGQTVLLGHEGTIIPSFGDERDLVWLELQNRFFGAVTPNYKTEDATFSARFDEATFTLSDFYGNYVPATSLEPVDEVVADFNAIVGPADGLRVFSTDTAVFALFSAGQWLTREAITDDIFLNNDDGEYYIFNGLSTHLIDRWNRPFAFEYSTNEFRNCIRRDFERFIIFRGEDFSENTTFDSADPFTWNYRSAGVEGHYLGIYSRVYNTFRPHSAPWEVMGYSIEPSWWRTSYVPDSTASDGSPRYGAGHPMWADFATGTVAHPSGPITKAQFILTGPVPVDSAGELLDPIAAGVVVEAKLDKSRLDDFWVFGDGAPEEQEFLRSSFASFSIALCGYLMKNGVWVDSLWVANRVSTGKTGAFTIFNGPHIVNGDTLTRPAISSRPIHLEVVNPTVQNLGVHSWISEAVAVEGGSPTTDFALIVKNTSPALLWKCAGYINQERTIISTLSRNEIPFSDVHVVLHKSQPISQNFCSGVLVVREDPVGYRVFGYDPFDPFFTIERPAIPVVAGQVLLEQEFTVDYAVTDPVDLNNQYVTGGGTLPNNTGPNRIYQVTEFGLPSQTQGQDTATLAVIIDGLKIREQYYSVDEQTNSIVFDDILDLAIGSRVAIQVLTTQSNPSTQVRQFVVNGVTFPYFSSGTGEFDRIEYGRFYETSLEVINFMIGYGRFLNTQGWCFDTLSEGGSTRDWFLGAQRFARWVLETSTPDGEVDILDRDAFFYSPVQDEALFISPFGQTTSVETIMNGAYGILNQQSEPVRTESTEVTRIDDRLEVRRVDTSDDESKMFGVRVNLIEAEHVVAFSNTTRFNDVIYDPVSGLAQTTLVVDSYRTLNWRGRLEAAGYILSGGAILPNFEKQAFDFTRFYDRFNTIDDPTKRALARDLYGYVPANQSRVLTTTATAQKTPDLIRRQTSDSSQYMVPVGAADRTRFDYYRGMVQTKGTNRAIYAFARGTTIGRDNFFIDEDWAWKVGPGEWGDTRREVVQFEVERLDFRDEVQVINFGDPEDVRDNTIEIPDFNRNDAANNPRWILPPSQCELEDTCNLEFPISRFTDLIDVENHRFYAKLFDTEANITILDHIHYDPQVGRFDTGATCLVNFTTPNDPARYNRGPDAAFADDRCWRDPQVGQTWWRQDRAEYIPYRDLLPEYEDAAKFWGKLLFYKARVERPGSTVLNQTQANFTTFAGGTGYAATDLITMSDSTVVRVNTVSSGVITEFQIETQGDTTNLIGTVLTQASTSGSGTGFTLTLEATNIGNEIDEVVITTFDFLDIDRTTPVPHGVTIGETKIISLRKADQTEYNLTNVEVTAISSTQLSFEIATNPSSPATGDPEAVFGHIDIYEWVESPVIPEEWEEFAAGLNDPTAPNGAPLNIEGTPSYTEITVLDDQGQPSTLYYFWVLNSSGTNGKGNALTSAQISSRIGNPTVNQIPWFAPVDANNMVIFTDGERVLDPYALEVIIDQRNLQTHHAFVLYSQGSNFFPVPEPIVEKMADSLSGIDAKGNTVPSPLLAEDEKFGSCFFPIQTVFADRDAAVGVYVEAANRLFNRKDLSEVELITGIFKIADEQTPTNPGGYWVRAQYVNRTVEGQEIYETVQTTTERDRRAGLDLYAPGDIVRVIESGATDPWTGAEVPSNYRWDGSLFIEVAVDNHTVNLTTAITDDAQRFRGTPGQIEGALYFLIYDLFEKTEQNSLMYSLLHEMKVQHPDPRCDWFFKTSYITTQVFTNTDRSPFVRPDEVKAIRDNILGTKAYRTKFRGDVNTLTISEVEPFDTNILEFPDKKVTLLIDRLSCNAFDECGWDKPAWDDRALPCPTWDTPIWDFEDLGRQEFYTLATIQGDGVTTKFVVDAIFDPTLYPVKTVVKQNGVEIDADYVVVTKSHTQVFVDTVFSFPDTFTVEVMQAQGFYADADPTYIGTTLEDTLFQPPASDYEHTLHRANVPPTEFRTVVGGDGNRFETNHPFIEFYLNGTLLEPQVDYEEDFNYQTGVYAAVLTVAPTPGDTIAFGFIRGCFDINDDLGGRPEERIVTEMCDSVNICVVNDWTQAYLGWDTTPWDVAFWDQGPTNVGRRVFLMSIGKQEELPPGVEFFQTSEDITVIDQFSIVGTAPPTYTIEQFELQKGGVGPFTPITAGVEFGFVGTFPNVITTLIPEQEDFIADGVNFVYPTTAGTEIKFVFLDGAVKTEGVDYTLDGTRTIITWVQPAPVIFSNDATSNAEAYVGDGFETDYETGLLSNSLNEENMLVWLNRALTINWSTVVGVADIRFNSAPAVGDEIISFAIGNTFGDNTAAHVSDTFTAGAAQTVFNTSSGGFAADDCTWVFVDGLYQVLGVDYTITGPDQVTFTVPLAGGEFVAIRTITKGVKDVEHIVFSSGGGLTDVIPGIFDAQNIDRMLIFVGDQIQNGWAPLPQGPDYFITDTNPDTINWITRAEITELTWTGVDGPNLPTGVVPAAYFDIDSTSGGYRFWFSDGSTTPPAAAGRTLVPVPFTATSSTQDISDAVQEEMAGIRERTDFDWAGITGAAFPTSTTLVVGQTEADFDGLFGRGTFQGGDGPGGTSYVPADTITLSDGSVLTVDNVAATGDVTGFTVTSTGTGIVLSGATLTQAATSGAGTDFELYPLGPNLTGHEGAYFDVSSTTTTYRFWFSDGVTVPPPAGGNTLVAVPFTVADPDIAVAASVESVMDTADPEFITSIDAGTPAVVNLKVAQNGPVLAPPADGVGTEATGVSITVVTTGAAPVLDPDFFGATNGGATSDIVSVELATDGAVPDAVDGAVPTGVGINVLIQGNGPPPAASDISVRIVRSIQMSTTVVIDVNPNPGQTVSAQFCPYIEVGDVVRYRFNGWPVGPLGGYTVDPLISPLDVLTYDIVDGVFIFDSLPDENAFFSINYTKPRPGGLPESILVRMPNIVADIVPDHQQYDPPNGFEDAGSRPVGTQVIDTTTNLTYTWDGSVWNPDPVPIIGADYYVTRTQQIWEWNGVAFVKLFDVGDAFTKPPVVDYPLFGEGIRYGTYALGTSANALAEYPDAYWVMQHPGDCPP